MTRRLALLFLLALPAGVASAAPAPPLLLFTTSSTARGSDLVVSQLDGTGRKSLTGGAGLAFSGAWSPDGNRVAFATNRDTNGTGPGEIYVVDADGGGLHAVTHDAPAKHSRFSPTWSPDGTQLAYLESNGTQSESADVWAVAATGGEPRRLTTDGGAKRGLAWQPDGPLVLYDRQEGQAWGLWTVDAAAGVEHRVADTRPFGAAAPAYWSPDGTRLAFLDGLSRLVVAAPDGSDARTLTRDAIGGTPSWSPDGQSIAYSTSRIIPGATSRFGPPTDTDVFVVDVASGRSQRLTGWFDPNLPGPFSQAPAWWPGGSRLFFRTFRTGIDGPIWQMNADGTCEQPVTTLPGVDAGPWWQPGAAAAASLRCVDLRIRADVDRPQLALGAPAQVSVILENDGTEPATNVHVTAGGDGDLTVFGPNGTTIFPGQSVSFGGTLKSGKPGVVNARLAATADEPDVTPADSAVPVQADVLPCTVVGTWGADVLDGTPGNDRICGLPGPDRLDGGKGNDYLDAGSGDDTVIGGPGSDTIITRGGRDVIYARDGQRDWIDCGTERDVAVVDKVDHVRHCEQVTRH